MKKMMLLFAFLAMAHAAGAIVSSHGSVGKGHGIDLPGRDINCVSTFLMNYDGSAENGYCWQYAGVSPPYYGAFAECYDATGGVCGVVLKLTSIGSPCHPCDIYVWGDGGGFPGNVLSVMHDYDPCPVAVWPSISTHTACLCDLSPEVAGPFWVGYWANSRFGPCWYFVAADTNGFGGCPMTDIVPGIGYPTGWNNVSIIWGPTQSIGIGAYLGGPYECSCPPVPIRKSSWGGIKDLYR